MKPPVVHGSNYLFVLLVASGVLLSTMDSSMVNVALPAIMRHFAVEIEGVKLVVLVYLLVITATLVFFGRVGDRLGQGRTYLTGMLIFGSGAATCSFAPTFALLLVARGLQALGAAMMMATGPAILKQTSSAQQLGRTLGLIGVATSCGLMIGPVISGLILELASWRAVFLFYLPLVAIAAGMGLRLVPQLAERKNSEKPTFDWPGAVLWVLIVVGFTAFTSLAETGGHWRLLAAAAVAVLSYLLYRVEMRAASPILPLALVRRRYFWTGVASATLSFGALFIVLILMPFYLDYLLHYSPARLGLTMMAMPLSLVIVSPASGWLYDRIGSARHISTVGLLVSGLAVVLLIGLDAESSFVDVFWRLTLLGSGQSMFLSPNSASVLTQVADRFAGVTSGILATARNFGMLGGTALAGSGFAMFYQRFTGRDGLLGFTAELTGPFLQAQRATLSVALVLLLLAAAISWFRGR